MATTGPKSTRKAAPKKAAKKSVKKAVKKTAAKKTATKKTVKAAGTRQAGSRRKAAPTKTAAGRRTAPAAVDRHSMIAEAAYYRAERSGFTGDPMEHWLAAEAEVDLERSG